MGTFILVLISAFCIYLYLKRNPENMDERNSRTRYKLSEE
jgi:hypothetical protein